VGTYPRVASRNFEQQDRVTAGSNHAIIGYRTGEGWRIYILGAMSNLDHILERSSKTWKTRFVASRISLVTCFCCMSSIRCNCFFLYPKAVDRSNDCTTQAAVPFAYLSNLALYSKKNTSFAIPNLLENLECSTCRYAPILYIANVGPPCSFSHQYTTVCHPLPPMAIVLPLS